MTDTTWLGDVLALLTALTWSVAVLYYRWGSDNIGALALKVFHNLTATVILFVIAFAYGEALIPQLSFEGWLLVVASALIGITLGDTFYVAAIQRIGAGAQALLDGIYAPSIIFMAYLFFGETFSFCGWVGSALVLTAIFIAHPQLGTSFQWQTREEKVGFIYGILSQFAMAACVILVRDLLREESVLVITAWRYATGSLLLWVYASIKLSPREALTGFQWHPHIRTSLIGTLLGPVITTLLWFASFKYTLAGRAAIYTQLSTIFIILLAWIFLKEPLSRRKIFAVILAVVGGYFVAVS